MVHKQGSALLVALVVLSMVTMLSLAAMAEFAQWRSGYQREITRQEQLLSGHFARWQAAHSE